MMKIPYTKPSITQLETDYVSDAAANGWGKNCYDYINRFEREFADYLGAKFSIATSSCTGAMTMALHALGVGNEDEVILADTNWIATVSPISHLGATPVFVDILQDTWCIDPLKAEAAITEKTKAIIATHIYGNLCDMDALMDIGKRYNLPIIEDSAEAIGSIYKGKKAGSIGTFSTFSFHGTKTLTTGEGGMFVTNNKQLFNDVLTLSNHGRVKTQAKQFWADVTGFKFKMSNIQAALGCAQLSRVNELVNRKRAIMDTYRKYLSDLPNISMNTEQENTKNGFWMPNIVFGEDSNVTREVLQNAFVRNGIDARVFFWPLSSLPMYENKPENKYSYSISKRSINLPSYHDLTEDEIKSVVSILKSF